MMNIQPPLPVITIPTHIEALQAYQPGRPPDQLKQDLGFERFINLASNENPFGPPPNIQAAVAGAILDSNRYPESAGLKLREALAERFSISPKNVAIGNGSESLLNTILRSFLSKGDEAITAQGTFVGFNVLAQANGIKVKTVALNNYKFDLEAIAKAITTKTKLVYLCNPNNPTGTFFTASEFEEFIEKIPHHVLVVVDEAYIEFCPDGINFPDSLAYCFNNTITLRTFSKAYAMAGLRLGYALAHDHWISYINKVRLPFESNIIAQAAGLAALEDKNYLDRVIENNFSGRAYLEDQFRKLKLNYAPSVSNFIMIDFGKEEEVVRIHQKLLQQGIAVRPLKAFGFPHCLRVTVGLPEENAIFINALKNIL